MRTGMLVIGLIILVLGTIFYFTPISMTQAEATTNGDRQEVQASATVPAQLSIGAILVGAIVTLIGLLAPSANTTKIERSEHHEEKPKKRNT